MDGINVKTYAFLRYLPLQKRTHLYLFCFPQYNFLNGRTRIMEVVDIMDAKDMGAGTVNYKVTH
jgi:hypothetical protein